MVIHESTALVDFAYSFTDTRCLAQVSYAHSEAMNLNERTGVVMCISTWIIMTIGKKRKKMC
jgi:hypothetical protein